jgi:peptidyl-tRNA hydrolase, PTH1 family
MLTQTFMRVAAQKMIISRTFCFHSHFFSVTMVFMTWIIVGLGNPGEEYAHTRHNAGRMALEYACDQKNIGEWKEDKKANATIARGMIEKSTAVLVLPDTFMNKSGSAVAKYVKSVKAAEKLVVVYDDLDLPLGKMKMSFDRGSGGHKGIESIARALKTKAFWRIRIGVSPTTVSGKLRKPNGEKDVLDFILTKFKPSELPVLKTVFKHVSAALDIIASEGAVKAMGEVNSR